MIGYLSGQVIDKHQPGRLVLDVNGVGYDVETSLNTFFQLETLPNTISLHIHTIVREDALLLYGFLDKLERSLFRELIKVNGVGPKLAMAILSSTTPQEFAMSIHQQNTALLTTLPGIGKKTAERLVVEMKDKLDALSMNSKEHVKPLYAPAQQEALQALMALGFRQAEAQKALSSIDDGQKNCEQLIRQALKSLSTGK